MVEFRKLQISYNEEKQFVRIRSNSEISLQLRDVLQIHLIVERLAGGKTVPILTDARSGYIKVSKKARKFLARRQSADLRSAEAFLVEELPNRILANHYIKVDRPEHPVKAFNSEDDAVKWLSSFSEN